MCGIIGYVGDRAIVAVLLGGLRKMEYRGYDSAGVCIQSEGKLSIVKRPGKVSELEAAPDLESLHGGIGIGHTRWATHGEPCERNAHPHLDCTERFAVVHNGIIENADHLRTILKKEGHTIRSDTDTEVLSHLIEKFYAGDLEEAVAQTLRIVEGTFGVAVLHNTEQKIVAARRGSPLIIGIGESEMFIASDVTALLEFTKRVVYMNDEELVSINREGFSLKTIEGETVRGVVHDVKWDIEQIEKGNFKHFMLKEIHEQPQAIENTLRGRLTSETVKLSVHMPDLMKRVIIVACGTSWHSALIGKHLIERIAGVPVEVDYASEFRYRDPLVNEEDLVVAISQSGETADTLAALREAKRKGAKTLGIVNVVGSSIAREVDSGIYLHAGPEIGVASTKAFTCQITALVLLALHIRQHLGLPFEKRIAQELKRIPDLMRTVLARAETILPLAQQFVDTSNILYLGRGVNFPAALEGALKLKEISYIHAEGYPAAEMKHGPIALVDERMPAFFIAPHDATFEKIVSNMEEIKARKGRIIAIVNEDNERIRKLADAVFVVPKVADELSPLLTVIPLQLFAYYVADLKGLHVDKPRNLAKSVTVE